MDKEEVLPYTNWVFFGTQIKENGEKKIIDLVKASSVSIKRHVKVKQEARLYDLKYSKYFAKRQQNTKNKQYHNFIVPQLKLFDIRSWQ